MCTGDPRVYAIQRRRHFCRGYFAQESLGARTSNSTHAVANKGSKPAARNAGPYENRSTTVPTAIWKAAPAKPAARPLNPVTVATTSCGNKSDGNVSPIVDQLA